MDILTKKSNYELYERGLYGNKLRTWDNIHIFRESGYIGSVTIRYKGINGGSYCCYDCKDIEPEVKRFISEGADIELFTFNESAPDERLIIQGEFTHGTSGYQLFYSLKKGKMRDCLKEGISETGIKAKLIMQHLLSPNSFSDIMELIDIYPDHVIEFSTYNKSLGNCSQRNTIIWEVRKY